MFSLSSRQTDSLLEQPETGMGYQRVEVNLINNQTQTGYVFNAEWLQTDDAEPVIMDWKVRDRLKKAAAREINVIRSIRVIAEEKTITRNALKQETEGDKIAAESEKRFEDKAAIESNIEKTQGLEVFKRFTAYQNDRRIRADGSLLPGTYATTEADARYIQTGSDAVERYALPDPTPAIYVFTVMPPSGTPLKHGVVQPANGHSGGGVEVIFTQGTPPNTVTGPVIIPPV